jgi:hypothetical protein
LYRCSAFNWCSCFISWIGYIQICSISWQDWGSLGGARRRSTSRYGLKCQINHFFFFFDDYFSLVVQCETDAVSGTEKEHVACDYALRLSIGMDSSYDVVNDALYKLVSKGTNHKRACDIIHLPFLSKMQMERVRRFHSVVMWTRAIVLRWMLLLLERLCPLSSTTQCLGHEMKRSCCQFSFRVRASIFPP